MKKILLLLGVSLLLSSCSLKQEIEISPESKTTVNQELAFKQFKANLESLNQDLGYTDLFKTKGGGRDLTTGIADAVGGALGTRFGASLGITVGSWCGPWGGLTGYFLGHKYGGTIGTIVASAAAGAIYDWCSGGCSLTIPWQPESWAVDNTSQSSLNGNESIGNVHNIILSQVRANGKHYVSVDGNVNINELYTDVLQYAEKMGIEDDLSLNEEYRTYMDDYFNEIVSITLQDAKKCLSGSYEDNVKHFLCKEKGFSSMEAQNIMDVISATQVSAVLDKSEAIEYEKEFIKLVDDSDLSLENKNIIKNTGSVSIMSTNYWYGEK